MSALRLAILTEIPAPYRIPLFNELAARADVEPEILFLAERDPRRSYRLHADEFRFAWRVLSGRSLTVGGRWLVVNGSVARALGRADFVLAGGWNQPAFWEALAWGRAAARPVALWVESTLRDARPAGMRAAKRALARAAAAFVVPGRAAREYVRALAPAARIVVAPNAVDARLIAARLPERDRLRSQLGLARPCVLYVGRLAPEKGLDVLLEAARGLDADVVLAGAGPVHERLRALAPPNARFLGALERDSLPAWYAAADVLCLPSRSEPWGMTLNEGAAAGLPLVATDAVGAAWDLIEEGGNGFRVPAEDAAALRAALRRLTEDQGLRARMGRRSLELASRFTPQAWAEAVVELARSLARRTRRRR